MRQYIDVAQDVSGNALSGATCLVQNYPSGTNANIFSDNGLTPIGTATVTADVTGQFSFFVADGDYILVLSFNGSIYKTQSPVSIFDGAEQVTFADTGAVNAYAIANSALEKTLRAGLRASFQASNTNTLAATFTYNNLAAKPLVFPGGGALAAGVVVLNGIYAVEYDGTSWQLKNQTVSLAQLSGLTGPPYPQTPLEFAAGITPVTSFPTGTFYRYGAKGAGGRIADAVITAGSAIVTSASGGFANAKAGMVAVVVDGAASRVGGRPAPLITTILSVQSNFQITLNATVTQPGTVSMNGTLNATTSVTSTSVNPITAGVGLTRTWAITGTNIPANTTVDYTSASTLTLSQAATGSGVTALILTAPTELCFGFDDSTALNQALSLPYPITDVKDTFLTTLPLPLAALATGSAGCNNIALPSALILFAITGNAQPCVSVAGVDRSNNIPYLVGIRYLPFKVEFGELDCCNTGLGGISLGPSNFSNLRARVTNPFRSALEEWFTGGGWQEGNLVDITCGRVGLHFHHKVNKSACYQTLGGYRIMGRSPGLNSVFLGINATTQPDQCGTGIRLYAGGGATADGGMSQNVWGGQAFCELDGERNVALSFGSDIGNSPVIFVDASANYVIEGAAAAAFSNTYRSNTFSNMVIEDISQASDVRGGFQYYAMANATVQDTTVTASSSGPWGAVYASPLMLAGSDNLIRWPQRLSYPGLLLVGDQVAGGANTKFFQAGYLGSPISAQSGNYAINATDVGKTVVNASGTQTVPQLSPNNVVQVLAFGGGLALAAGSGVTLNWYNGTTLVTTTPRTLANGAIATLFWQSATQVVITGNGIT
jgi:hypothetical protein